MAPIEEIPASKPTPRAIQTTSSVVLPPDRLIDRNLQKGQYTGIFALMIALIAIVGFFSRRAEYAILFATTLSIVLIVFFFTV